MAQVGNDSVGNNEDRFGGEYMIQDHDHLSETVKASRTAPRSGGVRQPEQSQSRGRQQGGSDDQHVSGQQGGERHRKSR